jgi:hypothetical protein
LSIGFILRKYFNRFHTAEQGGAAEHDTKQQHLILTHLRCEANNQQVQSVQRASEPNLQPTPI